MTRVRTSWLVCIAIVLILIGLIGAFRIYTDKLKYVDTYGGRLFNPKPSSLKRYALQEEISVDTPITVRIIATGGDIHISEGTSSSMALDFIVPYKPKKLDIAMMQRDGDTIIIDSKAIWTNFTGNVSQPVFGIDIRVPAGTTVEIRNTIGDITLDAPLTRVAIDASLGDIDVRSTKIGHLDAQINVSGSIQGNAPQSSRITLNTGDADLLVTQPGTHTIRTTTGNLILRVDPTLVVGTTHSIGDGDFTSAFTATTTDAVNTYLHLSSKTGDVTVKSMR